MGCMVGVVGISWFKNHFLPDEKQELERERQTKILKTNKFYPDLPGGGNHQRQGEEPLQKSSVIASFILSQVIVLKDRHS